VRRESGGEQEEEKGKGKRCVRQREREVERKGGERGKGRGKRARECESGELHVRRNARSARDSASSRVATVLLPCCYRVATATSRSASIYERQQHVAPDPSHRRPPPAPPSTEEKGGGSGRGRGERINVTKQ
jgi:hypothetical protein